MPKLECAAAATLAGLLVLGGPAAFAGKAPNKVDQLSVQLFNVDDEIDVYVNDNLAFSCTHNEACWQDITSTLVDGQNTLRIDVVNTQSGYAYGIVVWRNAVPIFNEVCGDTHSSLTDAGCFHGDRTLGTVRSFSFAIKM